MNSETVINWYKQLESIKATARKLNISEQNVRRILIENDLWSSSRCIIIRDMHNSCITVKEIAEKLQLSEKTVQSYLPHSKGIYHSDTPTKNALRIRKLREKQSI